ncbi:hypothetical protein F5I97DRAFT_1826555 [Phlebopus sp. FC_14]|nr:hypothetical protein F5I97DRAFT_1826555 [Phlebopus sp. FC_14]
MRAAFNHACYGQPRKVWGLKQTNVYVSSFVSYSSWGLRPRNDGLTTATGDNDRDLTSKVVGEIPPSRFADEGFFATIQDMWDRHHRAPSMFCSHSGGNSGQWMRSTTRRNFRPPTTFNGQYEVGPKIILKDGNIAANSRQVSRPPSYSLHLGYQIEASVIGVVKDGDYRTLRFCGKIIDWDVVRANASLILIGVQDLGNLDTTQLKPSNSAGMKAGRGKAGPTEELERVGCTCHAYRPREGIRRTFYGLARHDKEVAVRHRRIPGTSKRGRTHCQSDVDRTQNQLAGNEYSCTPDGVTARGTHLCSCQTNLEMEIRMTLCYVRGPE